jgi:hypothetical protein
MQTLREKLEQSSDFLIGTELVSVRGGMGERTLMADNTIVAGADGREGCLLDRVHGLLKMKDER